jgi:hypothetical protein
MQVDLKIKMSMQKYIFLDHLDHLSIHVKVNMDHYILSVTVWAYITVLFNRDTYSSCF